LILNLTVIPRWGMLGAALATLGTEKIRTAIIPRAVRAGFPLPPTAALPLGALTYGAVLVLAGGLLLRRGMLSDLTL
jgi:hypothetical protein